LGSLANAGHDYQTVVIDSVDKLETLIWADACAKNNWETIKDPGYGDGYIVVDKYWEKVLKGTNYLRAEFKMNIVFIGHSTVVNWPNPTGQEFPRWDIKLHKRGHAIIEDGVDAILMVDYDQAVKEEKGRVGKQIKSTGSTLRYIHCQGSPARNAKNRYGMPSKILYAHGGGYESLAPYFPGAKLPHYEPQDTQENG
jgi:hypothetical protein